MNIEPMTFTQKWDSAFSESAQKVYMERSFYYDVAMISFSLASVIVTIGAVVIPILSGMMVSPQSALSLGSLVTYMIVGPSIAVAQKLRALSSREKNLADQASQIRAIYEAKISEGKQCPASSALLDYWENAAKSSHDAFALANSSPCTTIKDKMLLLRKEKDAAITKVEHLFWKALSKNNEKFEKIFLDHGMHACGAISELATWDTRSAEERLVNLSNKDVLLTFKNANIPAIRYESIFNVRLSSHFEGRFEQALRDDLAV